MNPKSRNVLKKRGPGANGSRKTQTRKSQSTNVDSVPLVQPKASFKTLSLVFPPRMPMKLKYWAQQTFAMAATQSINYRWRPTAAFDVDPALGGTSMAGFAECAAFYATYRVSASSIRVTISNPSSTIPVTCIVLPMNADPTNSFSAANIIASVGNPYAKTKMLGLLGSPPTVITNAMTTQKIFGDSEVFFDHNFTSLVQTVPTNNWFWNICLYALAFIPVSLVATVEITVDCEFYDRNFLPA